MFKMLFHFFTVGDRVLGSRTEGRQRTCAIASPQGALDIFSSCDSGSEATGKSITRTHGIHRKDGKSLHRQWVRVSRVAESLITTSCYHHRFDSQLVKTLADHRLFFLERGEFENHFRLAFIYDQVIGPNLLPWKLV
jgi:hypothetical protein